MGDELDFRNYAKDGKVAELEKMVKRGMNVNNGLLNIFHVFTIQRVNSDNVQFTLQRLEDL
jgi:hypothetical protein